MSEAIKRKITAYINGWKRKGYPDDIPDEAPVLLEEGGRVPSYRLIVKAILKNDKCLLTLGYGRPRCELYTAIKREELRARGKKVCEKRQLGMF
jgi:predicted phosphoadenosine phosphosulfate sulfurtransferase